jgi:hypothetical protein
MRAVVHVILPDRANWKCAADLRARALAACPPGPRPGARGDALVASRGAWVPLGNPGDVMALVKLDGDVWPQWAPEHDFRVRGYLGLDPRTGRPQWRPRPGYGSLDA